MKLSGGVPEDNAGIPAKLRGKVNTSKYARILDGRNRAERRKIDKLEKRRAKGK